MVLNRLLDLIEDLYMYRAGRRTSGLAGEKVVVFDNS